jgi:hypothetical protein
MMQIVGYCRKPAAPIVHTHCQHAFDCVSCTIPCNQCVGNLISFKVMAAKCAFVPEPFWLIPCTVRCACVISATRTHTCMQSRMLVQAYTHIRTDTKNVFPQKQPPLVSHFKRVKSKRAPISLMLWLHAKHMCAYVLICIAPCTRMQCAIT